MSINTYSNINEAIRELQKRGFRKIFSYHAHKVFCLQTERKYSQDEIFIVEYHRFNQRDLATANFIVFAINCSDQTKGYLIANTKEKNYLKLLKFMDKVKIQPVSIQSYKK